MCGRMTLSKRDLDLVADEVGAICPAEVAAQYRPRWNVAPTDLHPIVVATRQEGRGRQLELARWGFGGTREGAAAKPSPLLINARSETVTSRPAFRRAFSGSRCVVPADGFYEWSGKGDERRPTWFHRSDGRLLLLAGLFEDIGDTPAAGHRFTILTTAANQVVGRLHDRMPAILEPADVDRWLSGAESTEARSLLRPAPEPTLSATPVSRRANSVKNDDPTCLDPADREGSPPTGERQLRLF